MHKRFLMRLLLVAVGPGCVWGQRLQNVDMSVSAGPAWSQARGIGGTGVRLSGSTGFAWQQSYGYQVARASAASLWIELAFAFAHPGSSKANIPCTCSNNFNVATLGLRFMVPVHSRLSFYGAAGGGGGSFRHPEVSAGASPAVVTRSTGHGVFGFGGGADVRLTRVLSLRAEVRDFVTGKGLSGVSGRHHIVPTFGVALHH